MRFRKPRRSAQLLDITPIVDTVFNLMIFFALSLNFISIPGIPVNLPRATSFAEAQPKKELTIALTRDEELFVNGSPVTTSELADALHRQAAEAPDTLVVISADTDSRHGRVVEVMDLARAAGLVRLAIATKPKDEREQP